MLPGTLPQPAGDRRDDRHTVVGGVAKPPVLGRAALRGLCIASLAFITYGTLGPLGHDAGAWAVPVQSWHWLPAWQPGGTDDLVANFAVYVPVGVAFRLLVRRRGQVGWFDLWAGLALSVSLSYVTEVLQQTMPARISSSTDILVNSVAALVGCLCAVPVQRAIRRLHAMIFEQIRMPAGLWVVLLGTAVTITAMIMTTPWTLTRPTVRLGFDEPFGALGIRRFVASAAIAFLCTGLAFARGHTRRSAFLTMFRYVAALMLLLEASQMVLHEHVCSALHALTCLAGIAAGGVLAIATVGRRQARHSVSLSARSPRTRFVPLGSEVLTACPGHFSAPPAHYLPWIAVAAVAAATLHIVAGLWHFGWTLTPRTEPLVRWVPFQAEFLLPFPLMLADILEQFVVFALLTFSCLSLSLRRGRAVALLLLLALITLTEAGQAVFGIRGADTTAPVIATLAWLTAVRTWGALYPAGASVPRSHEFVRHAVSASGAGRATNAVCDQ